MVAQNRPRGCSCPMPCRRASPRSARRGARAAPTPSRPASWRLPRSCPSPSPCGRTSSRPAGRGPSGLKGRGRAGMTEPRPPFALYSDSVRSRTMLAEHRRMNIKTVYVCSKMETKIFFDAFLGGLKARLQRPHRVQSAAIVRIRTEMVEITAPRRVLDFPDSDGHRCATGRAQRDSHHEAEGDVRCHH